MDNTQAKVSIMPGAEPDLSAATFVIRDETHTLGNILRWMIMKNPKVEFCGYSVPHPSENLIQVRIQMYDHNSALQTLLTALDDLDGMFGILEEKYDKSLKEDDYKKWDEQS